MKKTKYNRFVTKDDIDRIIEEKYVDKKCPSCHKSALKACGIEEQYDEIKDEYVILSFTVICSECGDVLCKWDNTNRDYFLGKRC